MSDKEYFEKMKLISGEYWNKFKELLQGLTDKDEYWDNVLNEFKKLTDKYDDTEFHVYAQDLHVAYVDALNARWKVRKRGKG